MKLKCVEDVCMTLVVLTFHLSANVVQYVPHFCIDFYADHPLLNPIPIDHSACSNYLLLSIFPEFQNLFNKCRKARTTLHKLSINYLLTLIKNKTTNLTIGRDICKQLK